MHLGQKSMLSQTISQISRRCKSCANKCSNDRLINYLINLITSMGRPKKLDGITPKRLGDPIGCAFTENGCSNYRNRVCEDWLPTNIRGEFRKRALKTIAI